MYFRILAIEKRHLSLLLISLIIVLGSTLQATAEVIPGPPFEICFLTDNDNDVEEQGGLTAEALGLTVGALGGLTVEALGLTAEALGLTVGALGLTVEPLDINGDGITEQVFITPAGQALTVEALGGLTAEALGLTAEALERLIAEINGNPYDFNWLNARMGYISSGAGFGTQNVALLILDDFSDDPAETRHGERVLEVAQDFVNGIGLAGKIHIYELDITDSAGNFEINGPSGVAVKLQNAVNALSEGGYSRFIVNMSFGLLACNQEIIVERGDEDIIINWNVEDFINFRDGITPPDNVDCSSLEIYAADPEATHYLTGTRADGVTPINSERQNPEYALGQPDRVDSDFGIGENGELRGFVSLGFDDPETEIREGILQLKLFQPAVYDPDNGCNYLELWETSFNNPSPEQYPERAFVEVSLTGEDYTMLGEGPVTLDAIFEAPPFGAPLSYQYIRITDATDPNAPQFDSNEDGYDVDGVVGYRQPSRDLDDFISSFVPPGVPPLTPMELAEVLGIILLFDPESSPDANDPSVNELLGLLQGYLNDSAGAGQFALMPFGAAGNYRHIVTAGQYDAVNLFPADIANVPPLLPAYAPQVMAICAHVDNGFNLAQFSHDGNFCTPGAWYTFGDGSHAAGTSYAAPVASVVGATWLTYTDPDACNFVSTEGIYPGRTPLKGSWAGPLDASDFVNTNVPINNTPLDCVPPSIEPPEAPQCDGVPATIYVMDSGAGFFVVGGPDNGDSYTPGVSTLRGTNGDDVIMGSDGPDKIRGRNGNDLICGNLGADHIHGQNGADRLIGGTDGTNTPSVDASGKDKIFGGNDNDTIYGGDDDDDLRGDNGDDTLIGGDGNDTIRGGHGNDHLVGTTGDDTLRGDNGDDKLWGEHGNDNLFGNRGRDELHGQLGADCLVGGNDADMIYGFQKSDPNGFEEGAMRLFTSGNCRVRKYAQGEEVWYNDIIFAGSGDDYVDAGDADDYVNAGHGTDTVLGGMGNDDIHGGHGDDLINGNGGNDDIHGGNGNDIISGDEDQDTLNGGRGNLDRMFGGDGHDKIRDNDGNLGAHGGPGNDLITVQLAAGWHDNEDPNLPRYDGKLSGGYGNDLVELRSHVKNLFVNITGDERDDPSSPLEGVYDCLVLRGKAVDNGSVIIKFEELENTLNHCTLLTDG